MGASLSGSIKWGAAVVGVDGKIYCPPRNAADVLVIDPDEGTAERVNFGLGLTGSDKWFGATMAPTGAIYAAPSGASTVLRIQIFEAAAFRLNGRLRFELEAVRDGMASWQYHEWIVRRYGYGFNYGYYYGGQ